MILLMYKETTLFANAQGEELPSAIVSLLQEFEDVVVDEMPPELPPESRNRAPNRFRAGSDFTKPSRLSSQSGGNEGASTAN